MVNVKLCKRIKRGYSESWTVEMSIEQAAQEKAKSAAFGETYSEQFKNTKPGDILVVSISGTLSELAAIAEKSSTPVYINGELFYDPRTNAAARAEKESEK